MQFYESETLLVDCVTSFLATGDDVSAARRDGIYVTRGAAETLSTFMGRRRSRSPPFQRRHRGHRRRGGGRRAARAGVRGDGGPPLADDNVAAARGLGELWNELGGQQPFLLLYAYPAQPFLGALGERAFREVCSGTQR